MGLQFRILSASSSGDFGAGGGPISFPVNGIVPDAQTSPYRGQGARYIYRKYFLNILEYSAQTGLPEISNVSVTSIGETTATVNWHTNEDTTTELYYGTTLNYGEFSDGGYGGTLLSGDRSVVLNGLDDTTRYYYKIVAVDIDNNSSAFYGDFSTVDVTPPVFSNVEVTNVTPSTARVAWSTDERATSVVYYGTPTITGATTETTTYTQGHVVNLVNLTPNSPYRYYVGSRDAYGNSGRYPAAGSLTFTTQDSAGATPLSITNVQSGSITDASVRIRWDTNNYGNTIIKYSNNEALVTGTALGALYYINSTPVTGHTGDITSLSPQTRYYFQVSTVDVFNQQEFAPSSSTAHYFDTIGSSAPVVTFNGFTSFPTSGLATYLTNKTATGIVDYALQSVYNSNGNIFTNVETGAVATSFQTVLTGLTENRAYVYRIKASADGQTGFDSVRFFNTTDGTAPVISNVNSGSTETSIAITWQTNEQSNTILNLGNGTIASPGFFTTYTDSSLTTSHSATINSLTANTQYVYAARSVDAFGNTGSYSGYVQTQVASGPSDTTPPVVSNISVTPQITTASFTWNTNEFASTVVDYSTVSNLATYVSITGQSGTSHFVNATSLEEETTYYYRIKSEDASNNLTTTNIGSFATNAAADSNLAPGDKVALIEFEWPDTSTMQGTYFPIRVCVPVKNDQDLTFNWKVEYNTSPPLTPSAPVFVQREVIKRDGGGNAKIVECIFPVSKNPAPAQSVGQLFQLYIVVDNAIAPQNTFTPYVLPRIVVKADFGGGDAYQGIITAEAAIQEATKYSGVPMRGGSDIESSQPLSNFPYCRTTRYYRRLNGTYNQFVYPSSSGKSMGVHFYVTHYDKNIFPDFYPQVDIRVSNAWINESAPGTDLGRGDGYTINTYTQASRGTIFYNRLYIDGITNDDDNIGYGITADVVENTMLEIVNAGSGNGFILVRPNNEIPYVNANRVVNPGNNSTTPSNLSFINGNCSHAMFPGSALTFRLSLYKKSLSGNKQIMSNLASLDYSGFVIKDPALISKRNWSNCRSFGPLNVYCPALKESGPNTYSYNIGSDITDNPGYFSTTSFKGRRALDQKCKTTYARLRKSLSEGKFYNDPLRVDWSSSGPVQFGPYRPEGYQSELPTGGLHITPFEGFNHSKYSTLWLVQDHKFRSSRSFCRQYSTKFGLGSDGNQYEWGTPSSFKIWTNLNQQSCSWLQNGGASIIGRLPFEQLVDRQPVFNTLLWDPGVGQRHTKPWNLPKNLVNESSPNVDQGCWYALRASESVYGSGSGINTEYQDPFSGYSNDYKLDKTFSVIVGHSHQIIYLRNMVASVEMINDLIIKDDLIMQADMNMLGFCPYGHNNAYYSNNYNLAEVFYGYDRTAYSFKALQGYFGTGANRGGYFGRVWAWPLWAVVAAYQLALYNPSPGYNDQSNTSYVPRFRDYALEFLKMSGKLYEQGYLTANGSLHNPPYDPASSEADVSTNQHPGIACKALDVFLFPGFTQYNPGNPDWNATDGFDDGDQVTIFPPVDDGALIVYPELASATISQGATADALRPIGTFMSMPWNGINNPDNPSSIYGNIFSIYKRSLMVEYPGAYVTPDGNSDNGIRYWVDGWINSTNTTSSSPSWKISIWAKVSTGTYKIRARIVIVNSLNSGDERDITNYGASGGLDDTYSPLFSNTTYQKIEWIIKQKNPFTGNNTTFYPADFGDPQNPPFYLKVYLYFSCNTAGANFSFQWGTSDGNTDPYSANSRNIKITTSLRNKKRPVFNFGQTFEIGLLSMAHYANASQILKPLADKINDNSLKTTAATVLREIRKFYYGMYSMPIVSLNPPYSLNSDKLAIVTSSWNSSSLVKNDSSWNYGGAGNPTLGVSWLIGTAYSQYHPIGSQAGIPWNGQTMWGRFTSDASQQNVQDKGGYVEAFAPLVAALCMIEDTVLQSAEPWSNTISQFANPGQLPQDVPAYLLYMWCHLGNANPLTNVTAKINQILSSASSSSSPETNPQLLTQTAAMVGFIDYATENPGLTIPLSLAEVQAVPDVKIYISNESTPGRVEIAATPNYEDSMTGTSSMYGENEIGWTENGLAVSNPTFVSPKGRRNAVTLYNDDGVLGGPVKIGDNYNYSVPFWVRYKIDENNSFSSGYVDIGVLAGGGSLGEALATVPVVDDTVPVFEYYNDPSGDFLEFIGSNAPGTNSVQRVSSVYYLRYFGSENLEYKIDFGAGLGNANGALRIEETYSESYPVYNGGLRYLSAAGVQYEPVGLTGVCTLDAVSIANVDNVDTVVAVYTDSIDGGRSKKYSISIKGKALRVKMECLDANTLYSGNYIGASIVTASGCDNPAIVEMVNLGANPIGSFTNTAGTVYYWSSICDITQSNAQTWELYSPYTGSVFQPYVLQGSLLGPVYETVYRPGTGVGANAKIVSTVNDEFIVGVSQSVKDLFAISTAPPSPFLQDVIKDHHVLVGCEFTGVNANTWSSSAGSVKNLADAMDNWGFDNVMMHTYYQSLILQASPSDDVHNPEFTPFVDASNAANTIQHIKSLGYKYGPYTIYDSAEAGSDYYNTGYFSMSQTGILGNVNGFKKPTDARPNAEVRIINDAFLPTIVQQDTTKIKNNYGVDFMMHDVYCGQGYPVRAAAAGDSLDQGDLPGTAKTLKDGIIYKKLAFDSMRQIVGGPLMGEGPFADWRSEQQWLYHGYVDANINGYFTNDILMVYPSGNLSGHPRARTNWWTVPEVQWYVNQPNQVGQGLSQPDRFFSPSDYDVAYTKTGWWSMGDMFPYTTGAMDRWRAYCFSHARAGFITTAGYYDGMPNNAITHEQFIAHYYLSNAFQQRMMVQLVQNIEYYKNGTWYSNFDTLYKTTRQMETFTGVGIHIKLDNLEIYVNHDRTPGNTFSVSYGGNTYTLGQDGYLAYSTNDGFVCFNASAVGIAGNTAGNTIQYCLNPGIYEYFHGKSTPCTSYGNISTEDANAGEMKIYHYQRNKTIYSETGAATPQIITQDGIA